MYELSNIIVNLHQVYRKKTAQLFCISCEDAHFRFIAVCECVYLFSRVTAKCTICFVVAISKKERKKEKEKEKKDT